MYSQTSIARGRGDYFNKSESPEVRIKFALRVILTCENSLHSKDMSAKRQKKKYRVSRCIRENDVLEISVLDYRGLTVCRIKNKL